MNETTQPAVAGPVEPPVMQHHGGEQIFKLDVLFGTVELQERPVLDGNRMGYEYRKVTRDRSGVITDIGPWNTPLFWLVFHEPVRRPWWVRLFGAA